MSVPAKVPCDYCDRSITPQNMLRHVEARHPQAVAAPPPEPGEPDRASGETVLTGDDHAAVATLTITAGPLPELADPSPPAADKMVLTIPIVAGVPTSAAENGLAPHEPVEEDRDLPLVPGRSEPRPEGPIVILVTSGKGGVGKSTISLGLAQGLRQTTGAQVGVIDADIDNPCLQVLGGAQVPDLTETALAPREVNGILIYSPGAAMSAGTPFMREERDRLQLLASMRANVDWSPCRYLIIDTPPGASSEVRGLVAAEHPAGAIIVTQPSRVSFEAIRRTHTMLTMLEVNILGVVENMSGGAMGHGAGDLAHDILGIPLLARIELSLDIARQGDLGQPMPPEPFAPLVREVLEWEELWEECNRHDNIA